LLDHLEALQETVRREKDFPSLVHLQQAEKHFWNSLWSLVAANKYSERLKKVQYIVLEPIHSNGRAYKFLEPRKK
jgi:hypothetical protein